MPDYKNGKIYRLVCNVTGLTYIGSTCQTLAQRLCNHRADYKRCMKNPARHKVSSFNVVAGGDYNIILLEKVVCESKDELERKERYYIETIECVNKCIPGRSKAEYDKEYHQANKEARLKKDREYHQANRDARNEYARKYNEEHREEIAQKAALKVNCGCGTVHRYDSTSGHLKTNKHKKWAESQAWLSATCAES